MLKCVYFHWLSNLSWRGNKRIRIFYVGWKQVGFKVLLPLSDARAVHFSQVRLEKEEWSAFCGMDVIFSDVLRWRWGGRYGWHAETLCFYDGSPGLLTPRYSRLGLQYKSGVRIGVKPLSASQPWAGTPCSSLPPSPPPAAGPGGLGGDAGDPLLLLGLEGVQGMPAEPQELVGSSVPPRRGAVSGAHRRAPRRPGQLRAEPLTWRGGHECLHARCAMAEVPSLVRRGPGAAGRAASPAVQRLHAGQPASAGACWEEIALQNVWVFLCFFFFTA